MMRLLSLPLFGAILSVGVTAQQTWDVGPDPSHDFSVLQDAFDAAQPEDVVIVHQQSYAPATCRVGIRLLSTSLWSFASAITVRDLPADQHFVMEGLAVRFASSPKTVLEGFTLKTFAQLSRYGRSVAVVTGSFVAARW